MVDPDMKSSIMLCHELFLAPNILDSGKRTGVRTPKIPKCILNLPTANFLQATQLPPLQRRHSLTNAVNHVNHPLKLPPKAPSSPAYLGKILRLFHLRHRILLRRRTSSCSVCFSRSDWQKSNNILFRLAFSIPNASLCSPRTHQVTIKKTRKERPG